MMVCNDESVGGHKGTSATIHLANSINDTYLVCIEEFLGSDLQSFRFQLQSR